MPIEIHSSSLIDDSGEERSRIPVTPHPIVRPGEKNGKGRDWCYISKPEHLSSVLHLRVFCTSSSSGQNAGVTVLPTDLEDVVENREPTLSRPDNDTTEKDNTMKSKRLLGREFLRSQQEARVLAEAQARKKRPPKLLAPTSEKDRARDQEEFSRQERVLVEALGKMKVDRAERDQQKEVEKGISRNISSRSDARVAVSVGQPADGMLRVKTMQETVAWAVQVSAQPPSLLDAELYSVLAKIKRFMSLFSSARAGASRGSRYSKSGGADSQGDILHLLHNLEEPVEDSHASLSEKLAQQEATGLLRFVHAIAPPIPHHSNATGATRRLRRTVMVRRSFVQAGKRAQSVSSATQASAGGPSPIATIHEHGFQSRPQHPPKIASPPRCTKPSSVSSSPRSKGMANSGLQTSRPRSSGHGNNRPQRSGHGRDADRKPAPSASPPRPHSSAGISFPRARRLLSTQPEPATEERGSVPDVVMSATAPVVFNHAAVSSGRSNKARSMSVMSVHINAAGEEEDVILTKLSRMDEAGGQGQGHGWSRLGGHSKQPEGTEVSSPIRGDKRIAQHRNHHDLHRHQFRQEEEQTLDEQDLEEQGDDLEERGDVSEGDSNWAEPPLCNTPLKVYSNRPEQWNSKDLYSFNDMFGVEEFQENAAKRFQRMHDSRESTQQANRRQAVELAEKSTACVDRLLRRFVEQHEMRGSTLAAMVHTVARKDFERPEVLQRFSDVINKREEQGGLTGHVLDTLREIKAQVSSSMHSQVMRNLIKHKWFLKIIHTLHEYKKKKMRTPVPPSLIRFLVACSKLLENNTCIDEDLFFELLGQLLDPKDQKDVIVHRSISVFRKQLGISPEQYSSYLERGEVSACPELLVEVREAQSRRARKMRARAETMASSVNPDISTTAAAAVLEGVSLGDSTEQEEKACGKVISRDEGSIGDRKKRLAESAPSSLYCSGGGL